MFGIGKKSHVVKSAYGVEYEAIVKRLSIHTDGVLKSMQKWHTHQVESATLENRFGKSALLFSLELWSENNLQQPRFDVIQTDSGIIIGNPDVATHLPVGSSGTLLGWRNPDLTDYFLNNPSFRGVEIDHVSLDVDSSSLAIMNLGSTIMRTATVVLIPTGNGVIS